jgi:hypothetical protein
MTKKTQDIINWIIIAIFVIIMEFIVWNSAIDLLIKIILSIVVLVGSVLILSPITLFIITKIFVADEENMDNTIYHKNNKNILSIEDIKNYSKEMLAKYGNQKYINELFGKGAKFIENNYILKEYIFYRIKEYNQIEMAKVFQFFGLSLFCFEYYFSGLKCLELNSEKNREINEKLNNMSHDALYIKAKLMNNTIDSSLNIYSNIDCLLEKSNQPGLLQYIAVNMLSPDMKNEVKNEEKIIDIIMLNHVFINIIYEYYI